MSRRKWKCLDCGIDTKYEHYFIHTHIWLSVVKSKHGMLCVECLEKRLNRQLTRADFTGCYINSGGMKSTRLLQRMGKV